MAITHVDYLFIAYDRRCSTTAKLLEDLVKTFRISHKDKDLNLLKPTSAGQGCRDHRLAGACFQIFGAARLCIETIRTQHTSLTQKAHRVQEFARPTPVVADPDATWAQL